MEENSVDIARLIARYLKGQELLPSELARLREFLDADKQNGAILEHYRNTPEVEERLAYLLSLDKTKAWDNVLKKRNQNANPLFRYFKYVAAIAVLFMSIKLIHWKLVDSSTLTHPSDAQEMVISPGGNTATLTLSDGRKIALGDDEVGIKEVSGSTIYGKSGELNYFTNGTHSDERTNTMNKLEVPKGGTYRLVLPDSSVVWLNAKSEIQFPAHFTSTERCVLLRGEAYFDVVKNSNAPFKVIVNQQTIEVLGTSFTIKAYDSPSISTTVITGKVNVKTKSRNTMVSAGQAAESTDTNTALWEADTEKAIAWKDGYFYFDEDPITEVLEQVARWYDVDIKYEISKKSGKFGGSITRDVALTQALEMIHEITGLSFEITNRTIHVKDK